MLKRITSLILPLLFASQAVAGGIGCGVNIINNSFNFDGAACLTHSLSESGEMACCAQGKSPAGALASMNCCKTQCGEFIGGAQFETTPQTLIPEPRVIRVRAILLDTMGGAETSTVSIKSAAYKLLHRYPPDFYLSNSRFLI